MKDIIYKNNRPLKIVHGYYNDDSLTLEEKKAKVTQMIEKLADLEFGGIVTNVRWNYNTDPTVPMSARSGYYTKDSEEWEVFKFALSEIDRLGLRAWIYDEHGYPSGGAGGLTLAANPEFEARAIARVAHTLMPGEKITIELPHGHKKFLYAASYPSDNNGEPTDFAPIKEYFEGANSLPSVSFKNDTNEPMLAVAFVEKWLYEGTHSVHNTYESRRYIDVMNSDAVREFIRNTYEAYTEQAREHYIDGDGLVEAYFTDEPSLMGRYINYGYYPRVIRDQDDRDIPLYPIVNYGRDVKNTFESLSGMLFEPNLVYLFYGSTKDAKRVRYFFHKTTSDLFEKSFYAQISNFCKENNTRFSGHVLLEDDIRHHVLFEGNYFSLLRHMHFPGIDMLHSIPEIVRQYAFTPKLISSIAHAYNRPHVMSEVSGHCQGGKITPEQMYASIALQYAFGVDIFTSYYSIELCDRGTYRKYNDAIGNIGDTMGGGKHVADVLLYYPIETFMMNQITAMRATYTSPDNYSKPENICHDGLYGIIDALCDTQTDFDLTDLELLKNLEVRDGKMIGKQGEEYRYLLLPPMELTRESRAIFKQLEAEGIKILTLCGECFDELNNSDFGTKFNTADKLVASLDRTGFAITSSLIHNGLVCLCRSFDGKRKYMLVNSKNESISASLTLASGDVTKLISPVDMLERDCTINATNNGVTVNFNIGAYETLIIE